MPDTAEPDYLRQHGGFADLTVEERCAWFAACTDEARAEGATWGRYSVDNADAPTMAIVEGWRVRPDDQGPIRWQLTSSAPAPAPSWPPRG